jgi:FkbM family methyltransferase
LRWVVNDLRRPIEFKVRDDWTLRCPRNAAERAFHLQVRDLPQVREFDEFIDYVRGAGRVVLLDVGCHFGIFCFAAVRYGAAGSRAMAVDPSRQACEMVERITRLNGWTERVSLLQAAAGPSDAAIELVETGCTGAGYLVPPGDHPHRDRRLLPSLTIDTLAQRLGEPPTVVKIDVEGFEYDVLQGGRHTFGERGVPIFLEIHNRMLRERGFEPRALLEHLRASGYRSFLSEGREMTPEELVQGEIVRAFVRRSVGSA